MTFDELFADHRLTSDERRDLVFHLSQIRARRTVEALLKAQRGPTKVYCASCGKQKEKCDG